jgi:cytochrome c biogenesis protein CcmG/thiol:disulfide interchange protein DsbE
LAVAFVVGALVVVFARSESAADRQARSRLVGQPAPILAGDTIDGDTFDLAGRRGRWVVVNFMASWCTPCRQEQPELVAFANRHAQAADAEVVAVIVNDTPEAVMEFFDKYGRAGPAVLDPDGSVYVDFGVVKLPETYIVDPDGIVVAKVNGGVSADGLDGALATLAQARAGDGG